MTLMTKDVLVDACKKNGGYAQPHLNDQLFLQYRGFSKIQNLEPYGDLKVLWLEQNAIEVIEGLDTLHNLVSLFLQNNVIRRITGLSQLQNLRILNVSNNFITKLENLRCCPLLETLQASHCRLSTLEDLEELTFLPELSTLDVSFNKLERRQDGTDAQDSFLVDFLRRIPSLSVVYMHGNELVRGVRDYRKTLIVGLPNLHYLDERPVFPEERRTCEAWGRGGKEAEEAERDKIREEKRASLSSCVEDMIKLKERTKDARDQREREWREEQAAKERWATQHKMDCVRELAELDAEEYEGRGLLEEEESASWIDVSKVAGDGLIRLAFENRQQIEEAIVRAAAEKELREEEEAMLAAKRATDAENEKERERWIKAFTEEDVSDTLQGDLDRLLDQLLPDTKNRQAELLTFGNRPPSANSPPKARSAVEAAPAATTASTRSATSAPTTTSVAPKKSAPGKDFSVWEKYYAFEVTAAQRKSSAAAKSTSSKTAQ